MSDALDKLIEAVEAGRGDAVSIFTKRLSSAARDRGAYWPSHDVEKAFSGSLDAALAMHKALLPGWALERLTMWPGKNGECTAHLWGTHEQVGERWHSAKDGRVDASAPTPARAWLLAILRAYRQHREA
ncbi:hypothetical protein [Paracoccus sp. AS002]|uniref:hypothetical protein n=1 Tax=Paracoccus sp. AS002 TaxID=3019545 RepID=UPI0023E8D569|nr:hypothetical protein [Paracoccus sp. AS002]MDF3904646.1 hypothetical protein [Paracoccus sp. AS002]